MHGAMPFMVLAEIAIPTAWQCLVIASPVFAVTVVWWMITRTNQVIDAIFPDWEWEKRLGWLNIRASRRADAVLRWIGYFIYALLAATLYGIVWSASAFTDINQTSDPNGVANGMWKFSTLLICLGVWVLYLGWELIPKLRHQYEREELEKYRAEQTELEEERQNPVKPPSPFAATDPKSRKKSFHPSQGTRPRR